MSIKSGILCWKSTKMSRKMSLYIDKNSSESNLLEDYHDLGICGPIQNEFQGTEAKLLAGELIECYERHGTDGAKSFINHFKLDLLLKQLRNQGSAAAQGLLDKYEELSAEDVEGYAKKTSKSHDKLVEQAREWLSDAINISTKKHAEIARAAKEVNKMHSDRAEDIKQSILSDDGEDDPF